MLHLVAARGRRREHDSDDGVEARLLARQVDQVFHGRLHPETEAGHAQFWRNAVVLLHRIQLQQQLQQLPVD